MPKKIEKFDRYQKIAVALGEVGGVPITGDDVRVEMRSKAYNKNIGGDGLLPPTEMSRLSRNVRHQVAQRIVAEAFAADAVRAKPVAQPKRDTAQAMRRSELIDQAMATAASRRPLALAKGVDPLFDRETQKRFKLEAWANYRAGLIR